MVCFNFKKKKTKSEKNSWFSKRIQVAFILRSAWSPYNGSKMRNQWRNIRVWKIPLNCIFRDFYREKQYGIRMQHNIFDIKRQLQQLTTMHCAWDGNYLMDKINTKRQCLAMIHRDKVLTIQYKTETETHTQSHKMIIIITTE